MALLVSLKRIAEALDIPSSHRLVDIRVDPFLCHGMAQVLVDGPALTGVHDGTAPPMALTYGGKWDPSSLGAKSACCGCNEWALTCAITDHTDVEDGRYCLKCVPADRRSLIQDDGAAHAAAIFDRALGRFKARTDGDE